MAEVIQMGRKHCLKGEIARYEQFLLFPQCYQKACFPGASKGVTVWEWVKKEFYRKECIYEISKLYHLPSKSYGQCKSFCGQTNGQTDRPKTICPRYIDAGA